MHNPTQQTATPVTTESPKKKNPTEIESFFDHEEKEERELKLIWNKPKANVNDELKTATIVEGYFEKKGKRTGMWKPRYYILTHSMLAYKQNKKSKKVTKVMYLDRVRIEYITQNHGKTSRFGFRFKKNKQFAEIFTCSEEIYNEFKRELEFRCIQTNFQEKYQIEKMIGKGSFGRVYLVRRLRDGRQFASKMFLKDILTKQKKGKISLLNEIHILRRLDHPGIMKLYEVHETSIAIYLVVELLSGGELFEKLKEKKSYTEKDCSILLKRMIEPLNYMHEKGIMHRDIKPENLILRSKDNEFDIVIADLGLATEIQPAQLIHARCGTPGYCAPEILSSRNGKLDYDSKVDVFSLGCVFYHIITGKSPFNSKHHRGVFYLNRLCEVNFDHQKIQALSPVTQELLRKMLAKNPKHRPTFEEVLEHKFFVEAGKLVHDTALSFVKQYYFNRTSSIKEKKSFESEKKKYERKESSFDSKIGSKIESNFDYGSFQVGRSNFFRGNIDTVAEMGLLSPALHHNNLTPNNGLPHLNLGSEGSPIMPNRKSSFSRQSVTGRDIMSLRDHHMMRDNPSISINISMHRDPDGASKGASIQDDGLLSKSSRTNSKLQSNASRTNGASGQSLHGVHEESSEDSLLDPDGEYSPVHRNLPRLRSHILRNPFNDEENNEESLLHLKVGQLKSNSVSARSFNTSKIFEDRKSFSKLHKSSRASDSDTDGSAVSSKMGKK